MWVSVFVFVNFFETDGSIMLIYSTLFFFCLSKCNRKGQYVIVLVILLWNSTLRQICAQNLISNSNFGFKYLRLRSLHSNDLYNSNLRKCILPRVLINIRQLPIKIFLWKFKYLCQISHQIDTFDFHVYHWMTLKRSQLKLRSDRHPDFCWYPFMSYISFISLEFGIKSNVPYIVSNITCNLHIS